MCAWGNAGEVCWASHVCLLRWCALMVPLGPWEAKSEGEVFNCFFFSPTNLKSSSLPRDVHQEKKGCIYQGQERRAFLSCPRSEEGNSMGVWEKLRSWLLSNWRKSTNRERLETCIPLLPPFATASHWEDIFLKKNLSSFLFVRCLSRSSKLLLTPVSPMADRPVEDRNIPMAF